jgi:hypothetical protein
LGPGKILVYPNPVSGPGLVQIAFKLNGSGDVKLEIFTAAFRKVLEEDLGNLYAGNQTTTFELKDHWGRTLANGLYYVVISQGSQRTVGKLLVVK